MTDLSLKIDYLSSSIKKLALQAANKLKDSEPGRNIARFNSIRPIDYMRYAEFDAILRDLVIEPQMEILDIGSPQWFSIFLAKEYPETQFFYANIIDSELEPYKTICRALEINNLIYCKEDVRNLNFGEQKFDKVISISVIEHIFPKEGGDFQALKEIKQVLKNRGELLITIPYKSKKNILYVNKKVYERAEQKNNFFAREYDQESFEDLIVNSNFYIKNKLFICEKFGLFALDYYEYGPGSKVILMKYLFKIRKLFELIFNKSPEKYLAKSYLSVASQIDNRVVNICATLIPN